MRTHFCGLVDEALIGQVVTLCGWADVARNLGGVCFIDLRDHEGIVQVVAEPSGAAGNAEVVAMAEKVGYEDCLRITGTVRRRHSVNNKIRSGQVEIVAERIEVLNKAEPLPFHHHENPGEDIRLKYRYLDLRSPEMQRRMRTRTRLVSALRHWLDARGFQDIETPILTKATPEGARDFLVPARMHPGEFYALPQSPQLFKQILMMAGFDRYYQIARCFRDEALRADRQLEFTQLDMEFAWVSERDVQGTVEAMIRDVFREVAGVELAAEFPRMTYAEAMRRYGSDKPDLRIALELVDVAELVKDSGFAVFTGPAVDPGGRVAALRIPGGATLSRKQIDEYAAHAGKYGAKGLAYIKVGENGEITSPIQKFFDEAAFAALREGRAGDELEAYPRAFEDSWLHAELQQSKNFKQWFKKGRGLATLMTGIEQWLLPRLGIRNPPWTIHRDKPDHACLEPAAQHAKIDYPRPDGVLTFDRLSSVFLSSTHHDENQPSHLTLKDASVPVEVNLRRYAGPEARYCPAAVYEFVGEAGNERLQINFANCVHCKTCDIKDPTQNIVWVAPQAGGGPNYAGM